MTVEESEIMARHFRFLQALLEQGTLVLAGPRPFVRCSGSRSSRPRTRRLRALMEADPAVSTGLQTAELHPFRVSLLRGA